MIIRLCSSEACSSFCIHGFDTIVRPEVPLDIYIASVLNGLSV